LIVKRKRQKKSSTNWVNYIYSIKLILVTHSQIDFYAILISQISLFFCQIFFKFVSMWTHLFLLNKSLSSFIFYQNSLWHFQLFFYTNKLKAFHS
jgi:hypothetical protein